MRRPDRPRTRVARSGITEAVGFTPMHRASRSQAFLGQTPMGAARPRSDASPARGRPWPPPRQPLARSAAEEAREILARLAAKPFLERLDAAMSSRPEPIPAVPGDRYGVAQDHPEDRVGATGAATAPPPGATDRQDRGGGVTTGDVLHEYSVAM